ncbi:MAG TPA: hypothetical protein VIN75_13580 [Burkholderiaceae bacterium]
MTRRQRSADSGAYPPAAQEFVTEADASQHHDAFASSCIEWVRQVERIEATSLAGLGALLQTVASRAASARTWAEWIELAGAGLQEAIDDAARTQGEWLSALMQCQMETVKMLLDLGRPVLPGSRDGDVDLPIAWFTPWMAGIGMRPVQIA